MTNQEIVAKLWNLCNVLRDDGITYHQYVLEQKREESVQTEMTLHSRQAISSLISYSIFIGHSKLMARQELL